MIRTTYIQKSRMAAWLFLAAVLFSLTVKSVHTHDADAVHSCQYASHCHDEENEKQENPNADHPCSICQFTFSFFIENAIQDTEIKPLRFTHYNPEIPTALFSTTLPGYYLRGPPHV